MNKENYQLSREDWKLSKIFRYQLLAIDQTVDKTRQLVHTLDK